MEKIKIIHGGQFNATEDKVYKDGKPIGYLPIAEASNAGLSFIVSELGGTYLKGHFNGKTTDKFLSLSKGETIYSTGSEWTTAKIGFIGNTGTKYEFYDELPKIPMKYKGQWDAFEDSVIEYAGAPSTMLPKPTLDTAGYFYLIIGESNHMSQTQWVKDDYIISDGEKWLSMAKYNLDENKTVEFVSSYGIDADIVSKASLASLHPLGDVRYLEFPKLQEKDLETSPSNFGTSTKLISLELHEEIALQNYTTSRTFVPNGIACPNCGCELVDDDPSIILTSSPPKTAISCLNKNHCNYHGFRTK